MTELVSILVSGAIFIGTPFLIAKLLKIKLFSNTNSYNDDYIWFVSDSSYRTKRSDDSTVTVASKMS